MPRWGLTVPFAGVPLHETELLVRRAEAAGWDDLWSADTNGPDGFTPLALAAAWTERMRLGTAIVNAFTRGPAVLAQHAAALADASGGRFVLGLGSSSDVIVERWNEVHFERPLSRVRKTVAELRPVLAGERGAGGFQLETRAGAAGADLHRRAAREDAAARRRGRRRDDPQLPPARIRARRRRDDPAARRATTSSAASSASRSRSRRGSRWRAFMFAGYATVPVYEAFFRGLGWGNAIDPMVMAWRAGDRRAAAELAPEELLREVFVFGGPGAMRERLLEFAAAGVTTLCLMPLCAPELLPDLIDGLA